jgi:hypothetical protein
MHRFRVPALAALTFAFCALSSGTIANASPPIPAPLNGEVSYPAGEVCAFPLRVTPGPNRDLLHIQKNGDWIVTGNFIQTATNLSTGRSLPIRSGGPLRIVFNDDGTFTFISHGSILWTFFEQDAGGPGLFLFTGRVVIATSAEGFATSVSRIPRQTDVCQQLT